MKLKKKIKPVAVIGRFDRVDLPGLGLQDIHAKVDTGAYTSSLHCHQAQVIDGILEFVLLDDEHPEFTGMKFKFKEFTQREIKNSFGEAELRFIIRTTVKILGRTIKTEFSLSNRGNMKFPILLGRKTLRKKFIIDVSQEDVSYLKKYS
ncbi:MAG: peptidase [Flammeovirgaceae bacterium]|nr:peptidase [Flammeovirgaceae bacterium]